MADLDPTDVAWLAGLYEGEGTIHTSVRSRGNGSSRVLKLSIRMTDGDVLARCQRIFGGAFSGPYHDPGGEGKGWKAKYEWKIHSWKDFKRICPLLLPYLGERRRLKMQEVMALAPDSGYGETSCNLPVEASESGYYKHRVRGEKACPRCMESHRLHVRTRTLARNPAAPVRETREQNLGAFAQKGATSPTKGIRTAACPAEIEASSRGYFLHRSRGEEPCDICLESNSLLMWRKRHPGESDSARKRRVRQRAGLPTTVNPPS